MVRLRLLAPSGRVYKGTTPVSTSTPSTSSGGRKSKRLERVPISVPSVTDPMEGSSRSVTSGAAAPVVPVIVGGHCGRREGSNVAGIVRPSI